MVKGKKRVKKDKVLDTEKEKVCEIFEVEKDGKEKTIESCGIQEEKPASLEQIKKERKIFTKIVIVMAGCALMFLIFYGITYFQSHFEFEGVKFEKIKVGELTFYKTSLPGTIYNGVFIIGGTKGSKAEYNFFLRTHPNKLEKIPFDGSLSLMKNVVLNQEQNFACNGGYIGIQNLIQLYSVMNLSVISDKNATCDPIGRYVLFNLKEGNETKISKNGPTNRCYNVEINNCEVLPVTEKIMLETLIEINKKLKE